VHKLVLETLNTCACRRFDWRDQLADTEFRGRHGQAVVIWHVHVKNSA